MPLKQKTTMRHEASAVSAVSYRLPLPVTQVLELDNGDRYPVCPRCKRSFDREYTCFCDRCGQRLSWDMFAFAMVRKPKMG